MRNTNEYSRAIKESSNTMFNKSKFNNTVFNKAISKLKTIIVIGALISISACSSYALHSSEPGLEIATYPVIQF